MTKIESEKRITIPEKDMEEIIEDVKNAKAFAVLTPDRCALYGNGFSVLTFLPMLIKSLIEDLEMPRDSVEYAISLAFKDSEELNKDSHKKLDKLESLVDKLIKLKGDK